MHNPRGLAALLAVIDCGTFEKAAERLCITPPAVSQRIRQLENELGQTLLIRSAPPRTTRAGSAVLRYARQLEQLDAALESELRRDDESSRYRLTLAVNADTLTTWLLKECLADWCRKENVLLELLLDDQDQTHRLLQDGEVTGCISALAKPPQGCLSRSLGTARYHAVASDAFCRRWFPDGAHREALQQAPAIRFNNRDLLPHRYVEQHFSLDSKELEFHTIPANYSYAEWIELGMGWGLVPHTQLPMLPALVDISPQQTVDVPLHWHYWGIRSRLLDGLSEALLRAARRFHHWQD
ncbi:ArgP/LysG family DNA-binding transcriptional regulator [Granulosicoccaceae sp. 1_MG-2023]|nr:ArgP/LysG family DNA-binding transcriptional regulator [Granulosicoccaceae sp. 1_MG-2023]